MVWEIWTHPGNELNFLVYFNAYKVMKVYFSIFLFCSRWRYCKLTVVSISSRCHTPRALPLRSISLSICIVLFESMPTVVWSTEMYGTPGHPSGSMRRETHTHPNRGQELLLLTEEKSFCPRPCSLYLHCFVRVDASSVIPIRVVAAR